MKLRSTGLGKTELEAEIISVEKIGDLVLFFANTTKPVRWKTTMAFQEKDLRILILALFKPKNLLFVLKALLLGPGKTSTTQDF